MKALLVPAVRRGMGSGHLRRMLFLLRELDGGSALLLEDCRAQSGLAARELLSAMGVELPGAALRERYDPQERWDMVVLDRRRTAARELRRFAGQPVFALDEGGPARALAAYVIDALPAPGAAEPNLRSLAFVPLPPRRRSLRHPFRTVLLSFGGEDPADLSGILLQALLRAGIWPASSITVVQGPRFRRTSWPPGVQVLRNPPELKAMLHRYDLVLTSFGLTTLEAAAAGCAVVNLNPSAYHRRLTRHFRVPEIGVRRPRMRKLRRLLASAAPFAELWERFSRVGGEERPGAAQVLSGLPARGSSDCPLCGEAGNRSVARFPSRTYFRCRGCGMIYLQSFGGKARAYRRRYFFQEYRSQYGRTYLEDFDNIKAVAAGRLDRIVSLLDCPQGARLLDVGCAYGPFLQAASERGFLTEGVDVAKEAAAYVRGTLGIPCRAADFEAECREGRYRPASLDVVTMWYVVEHFEDPAAVLRAVAATLKPGGVLAFATPSAAGISARRSLRRFLEASPEDHRTVWLPARTGGVAAAHGLRLVRTAVTGHHPERFPRPSWTAEWASLEALLHGASRLLRLGDTFEAYCLRTGGGR